MDITEFYRSPQPQLWQGREETHPERFYQIVSFHEWQALLEHPPVSDIPLIFFIGFASDEGVRRNQGREGAQKGPEALRQALGNLPIHSKSKQPIQFIDVGDIVCEDHRLEEAQAALGYLISQLLTLGGIPIVLGGGHEAAWGHYQGLANQYENHDLAIINFDAHFDMRHAGESTSGTPFLQIAEARKAKGLPFHYYCLGIKASSNTSGLFHTASQWNVKYLTCDEMYSSPEVTAHFLNNILNKHDFLYVSICLDVFTSSVVPGASAASPYGLQPWQVLSALHRLAASSKVIALDVVELAPGLDYEHISAKMGALCIAEFFYHWQYPRE